MQFQPVCLGIRFDFLSDMAEPQEIARRAFEELFAVLSLKDLGGLSLYGGMDNAIDPAREAYLVVIAGGRLKGMRRIHQKLSADAGIMTCLAVGQPFVQVNALERVELQLTCYGRVDRDGSLKGGEAALPLWVSRGRGSARPFGWDLRVVLAPGAFAGGISELEAVKRLTLAARRHFPGANLIPMPMAEGHRGVMGALTIAGRGAYRQGPVTGPDGRRASAAYAVLRGRTAVIQGDPWDFAAGEIIRRALDEGLRDIRLLSLSAPADGGLGCARALGVKFYGADGEECRDGALVERVDMEYRHPALREARFSLLGDLGPEALGRYLQPILQPACEGAAESLLSAADFDRRIARADLVVTGGAGAETAAAVAGHAAKLGVPVAVISQGAGPLFDPAAAVGVISAVDAAITPGMSPADAGRRFDEAADAMFRYIRAGREMPRRWLKRRFFKGRAGR